MTSIILLAVFLSAAATIILIIYLIDRINRLERLTLSGNSATPDNGAASTADNHMLGLSGKTLWDAMTGTPPDGFNDNDLIALRPRYEALLRKHIEQLFKDGVKDSQAGSVAKKPKVPLSINTLRGAVSSWIPPQHAATIYDVGFKSLGAGAEELITVRDKLDSTTNLLYTRTDLDLNTPFSVLLMPAPEPEEELALDEPLQVSADPSSEDDLLG